MSHYLDEPVADDHLYDRAVYRDGRIVHGRVFHDRPLDQTSENVITSWEWNRLQDRQDWLYNRTGVFVPNPTAPPTGLRPFRRVLQINWEERPEVRREIYDMIPFAHQDFPDPDALHDWLYSFHEDPVVRARCRYWRRRVRMMYHRDMERDYLYARQAYGNYAGRRRVALAESLERGGLPRDIARLFARRGVRGL